MCSKLNVSIGRDSYNLQGTQGVRPLFQLRGKFADLMFLFDVWNVNIDSTELLSILGFSFNNNYCTRS